MKDTLTVTHLGWFLFCPVWLASTCNDLDTPIPRKVPEWWFDFNFWLNDCAQWAISLVSPDSVGFLFYGIRELVEPFEFSTE